MKYRHLACKFVDLCSLLTLMWPSCLIGSLVHSISAFLDVTDLPCSPQCRLIIIKLDCLVLFNADLSLSLPCPIQRRPVFIQVFSLSMLL